MLNEKSPYKLPSSAQPPNVKAIALLVAVAVLLVTVPIGFLLAKGWLAPAEAENDPLTVEAEAPAYYAEFPEEEEPEPIVEEAAAVVTATATDDSIGAISTPISENGNFAPDVAAAPAAPAPTAAAPVTVSPAEPPPPAPAAASELPATPPPPPQPVAVAPPAATPAPAAPAEAKTAATATPATTAAAKPQTPPKREFKALSKEEMSKLKQANSESKGKSSGVSQQQKSQYNQKLYSFVRSNWNAPAPSAVGNKKLKVVVVVNVAPNGSVTEAKIKTPSYVKAMDDSARKLCDKLKKSKAPAPGFQTGQITIELKN